MTLSRKQSVKLLVIYGILIATKKIYAVLCTPFFFLIVVMGLVFIGNKWQTIDRLSQARKWFKNIIHMITYSTMSNYFLNCLKAH